MNDLLGYGWEFRLGSGIAVPENLAGDELDIHSTAGADETTFLFDEVAVHNGVITAVGVPDGSNLIYVPPKLV